MLAKNAHHPACTPGARGPPPPCLRTCTRLHRLCGRPGVLREVGGRSGVLGGGGRSGVLGGGGQACGRLPAGKAE